MFEMGFWNITITKNFCEKKKIIQRIIVNNFLSYWFSENIQKDVFGRILRWQFIWQWQNPFFQFNSVFTGAKLQGKNLMRDWYIEFFLNDLWNVIETSNPQLSSFITANNVFIAPNHNLRPNITFYGKVDSQAIKILTRLLKIMIFCYLLNYAI